LKLLCNHNGGLHVCKYDLFCQAFDNFVKGISNSGIFKEPQYYAEDLITDRLMAAVVIMMLLFTARDSYINCLAIISPVYGR